MRSNLLFLNLLLFILIVVIFSKTSADNVKKSVDENRDDNGDTNEEAKDESLEIPIEPSEQQPVSNRGNVNVSCSRRSNGRMHEIKSATHKQFPFVASVMSHQNDHLCSGTVVSNGLILTSGKCTLMTIDHVLLNATKAKKDATTVALHIIKTERFPTFTTPEATDRDVGIIYTEIHNNSITAKIRLSNFTSTRNIVDMNVLGFGLNAEVGQIKDLQYVGAENRLTPMHPTDIQDELTAYLDCIDTKVPTCFKDFGGPSIFDNELVGVVTKNEEACFNEMSAVYSVNKKLAHILPTYTFKTWLEEKIKKNEEQNQARLVVFPNKPVPSRRRMPDSKELVSTNNGSSLLAFHYVIGILGLAIFSLLY